MSRLARGGRERNLVDALNEEWDRLVAEESGAVARWAEAHLELSRCCTLPDALAAIALDPDAALSALIRCCQAGDQLAGRAVLQAMLGKIVRMARRHRTAGVDDFVAAIWIGICGYPLTARPRQIAANLALDALKAVQLEVRGPRGGEVTPYPPSQALEDIATAAWRREILDHNAEVAELTARRLIAAATTLRVVDDDTSALLTSVYAEGLSGRATGERHGRSPSVVRYQCSTAIRRMSRHVERLADAA